MRWIFTHSPEGEGELPAAMVEIKTDEIVSSDEFLEGLGKYG